MQAVLEHTESGIQAGSRIGPYKLVKYLQRGGMATVYLAYHIHTRIYVAIKVVDSYTADVDLLSREIRIMRALHHRHIVRCLDAGRYGRYYYLVMPYVQGGTLEDLLNGARLTLEDACVVLEQITSALAYIHARGILHRDIKPANILFGHDCHVYLTDFGISTLIGEKSLHNGCVMGTAQYIAPEVCDGHVDVRSDVYSVGILLYQMLTGYLPFDGPSAWQICIHHRETPPPAPSLCNPALPRAVERVILRALEKNPARRYQTVEELLYAYQKAIQSQGFIEQISSHVQETCQRLRDRLSSGTSPWQTGEVGVLAGAAYNATNSWSRAI